MSPYLTFLYRGYRVILEIEYLGQEILPEKVWENGPRLLFGHVVRMAVAHFNDLHVDLISPMNF